MAQRADVRPIDIETLERTYTVASFDLSPDGGEIAFTWNRGGNFQVWLVPLAGGEPRQLTDGDDSSVAPKWSPDGTYLIFSRDRAGDENFNLYRLDLASGAVTPLAHDPAVCKRDADFSADGSRIAFLSNEGGGAFNVWAMDADGSGPRKLTDTRMPCMTLKHSPASDEIAFARLSAGPRLASQLGVVDARTGEERILGEFGGMPASIEWSPDGRTIAYVDDSSGHVQTVLVDVASRKTRPLVQTEWEQPGAVFSPDGGRVAYTLNREGNFDVAVQDLATGDVWSPADQAGIHAFLKFTPDGRALAYIYTGATDPPDLWHMPLDGGAPRQITNGLPPEISPPSLSGARVVRYPTFDGQMVPALYYPPAGGQARPPAVLFVHGGPTGQHVNMFYPQIQHLTSHGFAVLAPNVRGSTGFGAAWRDGALRDWGGGDLRDLVAGRDYLAREGLADERRIAVMGASYGGYMTLMAMTCAPDKWGAGVSIVGIANLRTLYETTREGDLKPYLVQQIGTPEDNPGLYDERSPINFVERVQAPLLILQGANDPRVPLAEAEQMATRLRQAERTYELKVYPDEGHGFMKTANRLDAMKTALAFLQGHLGVG